MTAYEEAISKYGDVPLNFTSYYKYSFSFRGTGPDGADISVSVGGDSSDIYKLSVDADKSMTMRELEPEWGTIMLNGEKILEWSPY